MLRLQIISTGDFIVLTESVLTVEQWSTLFNKQNELLGSFSYEGNSELEPNRAILGNPQLITSSADLRTFEVLAYLGVRPWKQVYFNYRIENRKIYYHIYIDTSVLANRLKTLKLNQLVEADFTDQLSFSTRAEYKDYLMSTIAAEPGTLPMVFFPYKNDGAYKDADGGVSDISFPVYKYFNAWQIIDGVGSFLLDEGYPLKHTQSPFFYIVYVLRRIFRYFGLTIESYWMRTENARRLVMHSNVPVGGFNLIADYTYFMPDMTVSDFLKALRTGFGLLIDPDILRGVCIIESLEELLATENVVDLQDVQLYGYREIGTTLKAYTITRPIADNDSAFTDQEKADMLVLTIGDPDTALETEEVPLTDVATKMIIESSPEEMQSDTWRVPYIKQPVYNSAPFNQLATIGYDEARKFKLRILVYYGLVDTASGFAVPYGSADNLNCFEDSISDYTLGLNNTGAAYLAVERFYQFRKNSKPFEATMKLSLDQFFKIRANTRLIFRDLNGAAVNCLLDSNAADLEQKQEIFAKITVYPVIWPNNTKTDPAAAAPEEPPVDNGAVYVKFLTANYGEEYLPYPPPERHVFYEDLIVQFFADAAGLVPKTVTNLPVRYRTIYSDNSGADATASSATIVCTGYSKTLYPGAPIQSIQPGLTSNWEYDLLPSGDYIIIP